MDRPEQTLKRLRKSNLKIDMHILEMLCNIANTKKDIEQFKKVRKEIEKK